MLISRYPTTRSKPCAEDLPPCPVCEPLQCLCRPRFFAGQLLTEEDLNRLDRYIREKHRLHNLHLHGWGVVCGLEATCDACDDLVRVSSGYALSPCGNDIVVCEDSRVDVCTLIRRCRKQKRECEPPRRQRDDCDDVEETWVLAVCYDEKPSRGITALRRTGVSCSKCGGTVSACGCPEQVGGDGMKNGAPASFKPTPAQCEPTVICEGYTYTVYRLPEESDDELGALAERFRCCAQPYLDFARELRNSFSALESATASELFQLCCSMKSRLREILLSRPIHDCTLLDRLALIPCTLEPGVTITHMLRDPGFDSAVLDSVDGFAAGQTVTMGTGANAETLTIQSVDPTNQSLTFTTPISGDHAPGEPVTAVVSQGSSQPFQDLIRIWIQGLFACLCSVLLPPCPAPAGDDCVPLATVTLRKRDCRILRVCNWTVHRKFATTFPNIQYWLSPLPFGRLLRRLLERLCCELTEIFQPREQEPDVVGTPGFTTAAFEASTAGRPETSGPARFNTFDTMPFDTMSSREFSNLAFKALTGQATPLDPESLFKGIMGALQADKSPYLQDSERSNLVQYLLLDQVARPLALSLVPDALSGERTVPTGNRGSDADARGALAAVQNRIEALQSALEEQQKTIDALKDRMRGEE